MRTRASRWIGCGTVMWAVSVSAWGDSVAPQPAEAPGAPKNVVFVEQNGLLAVEAEHYFEQTLTEHRAWRLTTPQQTPDAEPDGDPPHTDDASGDAYLEALPDTRRSHDDPLQSGVNFFNPPGQQGVLRYRVYFQTPGRYYVWARIYSTNTEDNGLHVGLDGDWPATGQRMQWTQKNQWAWGSKQRTAEVHTGVPYLIYLDIDRPGERVVSFSMREDGTEFDKWLMTTDRDYTPQGTGPDPRWTKRDP